MTPLSLRTFVKVLVVSLTGLIACEPESAKEQENFHVPAIFSDHMVIQRETPLSLWGWCGPGETVRIRSEWGQEAEAKADAHGAWQGSIQAPEAGGPFTVTLNTSDTTLVLHDVYSGEVWVASGQSNMEMPVSGWIPGAPIDSSAAEIRAADYSEIRMFTVERALSVTEKENVSGTWEVCNPSTVGSFSATAYFFARQLQKELNIPVGIIHSSWGGTPAESWISRPSLEKFGQFDQVLKNIEMTDTRKKEVEEWTSQLTVLDATPGELATVGMNDSTAADAALDDSDWKTMELPTLWEQTELGDFDGAIWFRRTFSLDNAPQGEYKLSLGPIDDMDVVYINGTRVGSTLEENKYMEDRNYPVPATLLRQGDNSIAVKVIDPQGGGGMYGSADKMYLKVGDNNQITLYGKWKYLPVAEYRGGKLYLMGVKDNKFSSRPDWIVTINANTPGVLYNAMIAPIIQYSFKGVIWYQGEANVGRADQYETLFPTLISDWRSISGRDFPFYYVQIAPFNYNEPDGDASAKLRDAQRKALNVPKTGMVVTLDIGNPDNIHPGNKQTVGTRLADLALAETYNMDRPASGPQFSSIEVSGSEITVSFTHADGLQAHGALDNVEIAGDDGIFHPAKARIEGEKLIASATEVPVPVAIRYAWKNVDHATLFNGDGLPASSFMERK